jgi:predicted TPR repeat methyltransferase
MPDLLHAERAKYEDAWALPAYAAHAPGERYLPIFLSMVNAEPRARVLDAGCGSGKGAAALLAAGFDVEMCDFTADGIVPEARGISMFETCLWDEFPRFYRECPYDYVYCTDVLEHVPQQLTMLVVARLLAVARCGLFLTVSTTPDQFGVWVGKQLHETVQPFTWWRDSLAAVGVVDEARDLLNAAAFLVRRK